MKFESMKKAAQIAAVTMSSAAIPQVAPISRWCNASKAYVPTPGSATENPAERLRAEVSQAQSDLDEIQSLISRAKQLCNNAERKPFVERGWTTTVTPEESAEIRRCRTSLDAFAAVLPAAFQAMISAVEKLNLELGEHFAGDVTRERNRRT
jgi:hypothetical protein